MFTDNVISAQSLSDQLNIEVMRDFNFSYCGKIGLNLPNMLVPIESDKYLESCHKNPHITGVVCNLNLVDKLQNNIGIIVSDSPKECVNDIQEFISNLKEFQWKDFQSEIHKSAEIHPTAFIAEKNVLVGKNVKVGPNSVVHERTVIEEGASVGSCSVIGCEAFENNITTKGLKDFSQSGGVKIKRFARIFSNTCIVRATYGGFTEIGERSMIDNLVYIAHDVSIGSDVKVIGCASILGRVSIGDKTTVGTNATILNGVSIGKNCDISLGSVVTKSVEDGKRVTGNFAIPHEEFIYNLKKGKK